MKRFALLSAALLGNLAIARADVDETRPYGRVCVTVMGPAERQEEPFRPVLHPGPGERIGVCVDANVSCQMLIAAFHPATGRIVNNWLPQMVELAEWEETRVPKNPIVWKWLPGSEPFDIYVLFADNKSPDLKELQSLLAAILKSGSNAPLLERQSVKLRELITRSIVDPEKARSKLPSERAEIGGTYRGMGSSGVGFAWRKYASSVNFSETKPGLLIFPGTPSESGSAPPGSRVK